MREIEWVFKGIQGIYSKTHNLAVLEVCAENKGEEIGNMNKRAQPKTLKYLFFEMTDNLVKHVFLEAYDCQFFFKVLVHSSLSSTKSS